MTYNQLSNPVAFFVFGIAFWTSCRFIHADNDSPNLSTYYAKTTDDFYNRALAGVFLDIEETFLMDPIIDGYAKQPPVKQLAFLEALASFLRQDSAFIDVPYSSRDPHTRHDLSIAAGKAAWGLERLLNIELQPISSNASANVLHASYQTAINRINELREQIENANQSEPDIATLKEQYAQKFVHALETMEGSAPVIQRLFKEWNPIGKPIDSLLQILGLEDTPVRLEEIDLPVELAMGDGEYYVIDLKGGLVQRTMIFRVSSGKIQAFGWVF